MSQISTLQMSRAASSTDGPTAPSKLVARLGVATIAILLVGSFGVLIAMRPAHPAAGQADRPDASATAVISADR